MEKYIYIVLFSPLLASILAGFASLSKKNIMIGWGVSAMIALSMYASFVLLFNIYTTNEILYVNLFDWIVVGSLDIGFSFVIDHLSIVMMCIVTTVSTMVHIHSIGYMSEDENFNRYFSYLSAFVFSMLVLVMADNFAVLFVGWEGVGLCSWLLIGFWYKKNSAAWAANEAFIMNRIGDLGLLLAMFLIYWNIGSLDYDKVFSQIANLDSFILSLIALLLFLGAMGKSAQFPLHTWLADAMEGPTPVSALIHAATMVTAGVYLVIRANEIYDLVPHVGYFIACLGAFVAIFAASMACVNNDLKRIIAYSTLSQLGYMFVAVGLGAYWVALFHLATHAFFKSLLFLGAGNVMHAMKDELDIRKMGGLHKKMKPTSLLMIIASLALAGIFPLSGFFSKDKILEASFNGQFYVLYFVLFLSAILTAFYSFRLIMKVFFMEARYEQKDIYPHEAKFFVIASMIPLATLAVVAGWFEHEFIAFVTKLIPAWEASNLSSGSIYALIALVSIASISSIYFAISKYKKGGFSKEHENKALYKLLINQYYLPQIYHKMISKPYYLFSKWVFDVIETKIIDNLIDNIAKGIYFLGSKAQVIQNGNLSNMLRIMSFALLVLLIIIMLLAVL